LEVSFCSIVHALPLALLLVPLALRKLYLLPFVFYLPTCLVFSGLGAYVPRRYGRHHRPEPQLVRHDGCS
jgi:hypothetical protein